MKKLIFVLAILIATLTANAQKTAWQVQYFDTLDNSTALTYTIDQSFLDQNVWEITASFQADSVSGSTAGTMVFQVSEWTTGAYWHTLFTKTIDGVQTTSLNEDTFQAKRARVYITGGGTQRTYCRFAMCAKGKY